MAQERIDQEKIFERGMNEQFGRAFFFNPELQEFVVGTKDCTYTFPLHDVDDLGYFARINPVGLSLDDEPYYLLMRGFELRVQPATRKYIESLDDNQWRELRKKVCEVIQTVYRKLSTHNLKPPIVSSGFVGINARRLRDGNFSIQTLGNCACLSPDASGKSPYETSDDFGETYGFHNSDNLAQDLSLYAGIGAIAWYAETETSRDL